MSSDPVQRPGGPRRSTSRRGLHRGPDGWRMLGLSLSLGLVGLGVMPVASEAQPSLRWTTNYYQVTGETPREIRRSISEARPWRNRSDSDATTTWTVTWNYTTVSGEEGCPAETVRTVTTIATTLPLF